MGKCHVERFEKPIDEDALKRSLIAYLAVFGMGCPRCALRVRNSLLRLEGVVKTEVDLGRGIAAVAFDPKETAPDGLLAAVARAGDGRRHRYAARLLAVVPVQAARQVEAEGGVPRLVGEEG